MDNIKWIFFDIGYTLVDEDLVHKMRIDRVIKEENTLDKNITHQRIWEEMIASAKAYQLSPFKGAMKKLGLSNNYTYNTDYEKPYEDALPVISELSKKYHIGVIGNQLAGTEQRLKTYGLADYIEICISSTEEGLAKPDPKIYELALKRTNCKALEAVMIGDRLDNDIYPAKKIGMKTVWVRQGFGGMQEPISKEYYADYTVNSLLEVLGIFFT